MVQLLIILFAFLAGASILFLAVLAYRRDPSGAVNRAFAFFAGLVGLWALVNFVAIVTGSQIVLRLTYALGSVIPLAGVVFAYAFTGRRLAPAFKIAASALAAFFFGASFTPLLVVRVYALEQAGFRGELGAAFVFWLIFMTGLLALALARLLAFFFSSRGKARLEVSYVLLGMGLSGCWAILVSVILPASGYLALSNTDAPSTMIMVGLISYAILKHQLMDIRVFVTRALLGSLVIGLVSGFLFALIFVGAWFFSVLGLWGVALISFAVAISAYFIGLLFYRAYIALQARTRELENIRRQLEEAKNILEIKVQARTKELQEFNQTLEQKVSQKTSELTARLQELEKFHSLTVGRELKMVELKKELAALQAELKKRFDRPE